MEQHTPVYKSGEDLRNDLEQLPVGAEIIYHGVPHKVVDAGNQGHRVAALRSPESWEITSIEDRKGFDIEIFIKGSREDVIATVYDESHALLIVKAPEMHDELIQLRQDKAELVAALHDAEAIGDFPAELRSRCGLMYEADSLRGLLDEICVEAAAFCEIDDLKQATDSLGRIMEMASIAAPSQSVASQIIEYHAEKG